MGNALTSLPEELELDAIPGDEIPQDEPEPEELFPLLVSLIESRPALLLEIGTVSNEYSLGHADWDGTTWMSPHSTKDYEELMEGDIREQVTVIEVTEVGHYDKEVATTGDPKFVDMDIDEI